MEEDSDIDQSYGTSMHEEEKLNENEGVESELDRANLMEEISKAIEKVCLSKPNKNGFWTEHQTNMWVQHGDVIPLDKRLDKFKELIYVGNLGWLNDTPLLDKVSWQFSYLADNILEDEDFKITAVLMGLTPGKIDDFIEHMSHVPVNDNECKNKVLKSLQSTFNVYSLEVLSMVIAIVEANNYNLDSCDKFVEYFDIIQSTIALTDFWSLEDVAYLTSEAVDHRLSLQDASSCIMASLEIEKMINKINLSYSITQNTISRQASSSFHSEVIPWPNFSNDIGGEQLSSSETQSSINTSGRHNPNNIESNEQSVSGTPTSEPDDDSISSHSVANSATSKRDNPDDESISGHSLPNIPSERDNPDDESISGHSVANIPSEGDNPYDDSIAGRSVPGTPSEPEEPDDRRSISDHSVPGTPTSQTYELDADSIRTRPSIKQIRSLHSDEFPENIRRSSLDPNVLHVIASHQGNFRKRRVAKWASSSYESNGNWCEPNDWPLYAEQYHNIVISGPGLRSNDEQEQRRNYFRSELFSQRNKWLCVNKEYRKYFKDVTLLADLYYNTNLAAYDWEMVMLKHKK